MFSQDWIQEAIALLVCLAALYLITRPFRKKKPPPGPKVEVGSRLQRGLRKAEKNKQ